MRWHFQEIETHWTSISLGFKKHNHRGWKMDELHIFLGPLTIVFVSDEQMQNCGGFILQ
jgi:hypothetical protein